MQAFPAGKAPRGEKNRKAVRVNFDFSRRTVYNALRAEALDADMMRPSARK